MKLGTETGSLINHLRSSDPTPPVVGKGATELMWSDRCAYFVDRVSKDGKEVVIERAKAVRIDNNGMSECQEYRYEREPNEEPITLRFTYGKWRKQYICAWTGKKKYSPMNIVFGYMNEYYDYSF